MHQVPKKRNTSLIWKLLWHRPKRNGCPFLASINRLKSYKTATCYSESSFFKIRSQQQQLASSSHQRPQSLVNFLSDTWLHSEISAQLCRNWITFPFAGSEVQLNKTQVSPYEPTKLAIHSILRPEDDLMSNCGRNFKMTVSFGDTVHFTHEENIVTCVDFDCGITFYPKTASKIRQINRERNYNFRSCEKPKCIPSNYQHYCCIDEQHSSNLFLNP